MIRLERKVWMYILIVFALTYTIQLIGILSGGEASDWFKPLIALTMFIPGLVAIVYLIKTKQGLNYIDWKLRKPWYIIISLMLPAIITLIGIAAFEYVGWGKNYAYSIKDQVVQHIDIPLFLGSDPQNIPMFIFNFVITGIGFSLITSLLTIGEEVGWRGFLQKKLLEKNGLLKSLIFLGILWGFWHFPLILTGLNYPEYPILGAFLIFPLTTVFVSFFFGYLSINSRSIWPAVFAHGGINSIMIFLFELDFGAHKLEANFAILGLWVLIGLVAYSLIQKNHIHRLKNTTEALQQNPD